MKKQKNRAKAKAKQKTRRLQKSNILLIGFMLVFVVTGISGLVMLTYTINNDKQPADIVVYKSPTCVCCNKWVTHLEHAGFRVKSINENNMALIKDKYDVTRGYQSCHTALAGKYFVEGHVPASEIKKLLNNKPDAKGLSVPGMPMGSPGMEGGSEDTYSVLLIAQDDQSIVYKTYK